MPPKVHKTNKLGVRLKPTAKRVSETLADRQHFALGSEDWAAFMAALKAPPRQPARLARLLSERSIFEAVRRR